MGNKRFLLITTTILLLLLTGCKTTVSYKKLTSDDCIVVIPTETITPRGKSMARTYYLKVSNINRRIPIPKGSMDYILIKIRKDNHKIISMTSKITDPGYVGQDSAESMNLQLPYTPGEVVVANFKIIQKMEETGSNSFTSWGYMVPTEDGDKNRVSKIVGKDPLLNSWN